MPIDTADFEELTFEYTPEELGIDTKNAAKIEEIKRLRPLSTMETNAGVTPILRASPEVDSPSSCRLDRSHRATRSGPPSGPLAAGFGG